MPSPGTIAMEMSEEEFDKMMGEDKPKRDLIPGLLEAATKAVQGVASQEYQRGYEAGQKDLREKLQHILAEAQRSNRAILEAQAALQTDLDEVEFLVTPEEFEDEEPDEEEE